jgi:hypothetical protein
MMASRFAVVNPPESARSYSSIWNDCADHKQSMLDSPQAWSARSCDKASGAGKEWLMMDLGKVMSVGGVVIQARADQPEYVTELEVLTAEQAPASSAEDEMDKRLKQAGAKKGAITISLMWENNKKAADLDICVDCPTGQINYKQRKVGKATLDTDNRGSGPAVENVYWETAEPGRFKAHIKNFTADTRTPYTVRFSSETVVKLIGPDGSVLDDNFRGTKIFTGSVLKPENPTVFCFEVATPEARERAEAALASASPPIGTGEGRGLSVQQQGFQSLGRFHCPATTHNRLKSRLIFPVPARARFIKLIAWDWVAHISMRAGILDADAAVSAQGGAEEAAASSPWWQHPDAVSLRLNW